jgi:hypothetical protein
MTSNVDGTSMVPPFTLFVPLEALKDLHSVNLPFFDNENANYRDSPSLNSRKNSPVR